MTLSAPASAPAAAGTALDPDGDQMLAALRVRGRA